MSRAREIITQAIPCNIVYGREQAAHEILEALHAAGFRILGPGDEDRFGLEWFERTFGVPLGDKPGAQDVERICRSLTTGGQDE